MKCRAVLKVQTMRVELSISFVFVEVDRFAFDGFFWLMKNDEKEM